MRSDKPERQRRTGLVAWVGVDCAFISVGWHLQRRDPQNDVQSFGGLRELESVAQKTSARELETGPTQSTIQFQFEDDQRAPTWRTIQFQIGALFLFLIGRQTHGRRLENSK